MADLKSELGIVPHSYQGKDGDFQGPQCAKFLANQEKFKDRLLAKDNTAMFYRFFLAFKNMKDGIFSSVLASG